MDKERAISDQRANRAERTKQSERNWFDVWQAKRIGAKSNLRRFQLLKAVSDLAGQPERTKGRKRTKSSERTK